MVEIKKFDVMSVAKIYAVILAVIGFIEGLLFALIGGLLSTVGTGGAAVGLGFGIAGIIILPIVFAIMGFIAGAIGAFVYNIVAGAVGGIKFE